MCILVGVLGFMSLCVCLWVSPYLMVPVGEGSGEPKALMCSSCCCAVGMLILRGEMWGRSGRGGREGCSLSLCSSGSMRDMNWILMTVLGKRNTHLERTGQQEGEQKMRKQRRKLISAFSPLKCSTVKQMSKLKFSKTSNLTEVPPKLKLSQSWHNSAAAFS